MDLYYAPMTCSLASHVACLEADLDVTLKRIGLRSKVTDDGVDVRRHNPLGKVPVLVLDSGDVLTENAAVLLYLGDLAPERGLAPRDDLARYELVRWLSFVASELHRRVAAPLFALDAPPRAVKDYACASAPQVLGVVDAHLRERSVLVGDTFTVADAYLFWVLTILPFGGVPVDGWPSLRRYLAEHAKRPAVHDALVRERREYAAAPVF